MYSLFVLSEERRLVTYLDSLQAKVHALRELQSPALRGWFPIRERRGVAPVLWADADIVPGC